MNNRPSRIYSIYVLSDGRYEVRPEDVDVRTTLVQQASAGVLAFFARILPSLKKRPLSDKQEFAADEAELYSVIHEYEKVRKNLTKARQKVRGVATNPLPDVEEKWW